MNKNLTRRTLINGTDIWTAYGAFLAERRPGGHENLKAILAPSGVKAHVAVDLRERDGERYASRLEVRNQARDVQLCFALYAGTRQAWLSQFEAFIGFLKQGDGGWLDIRFPDIGKTLHVFFRECSGYEPLTNLWRDGRQTARFLVTFREPQPDN